MANSTQGFQELIRKLSRREQEAGRVGRVAVLVGFTARYALWIHENVEMKWAGLARRSGIGVYWGPKGQAKYLEQPARRFKNDGTFVKILLSVIRRGGTLLQGLSMCGLRLQREAQLHVPVEHGNLKNSAFTREEKR